MNRITLIVALALPITTPANATAIAAPAATEVYRPGDHAMSCSALAAEINSLATAPAAVPPAPKKKSGLLSAFGKAATFMPGVAFARSAMLVTAASVAQAGLQAKDMKAAEVGNEPAGASPQAQRRERLAAIFEEKRC